MKKTEISILKANFNKLKTIANFLDISLDEVINVGLYPGLYKLWLPIARIMDEFPDWGLDSGEETERLYKLKQKYIEEVHTANKRIQEIEAIVKRFNKTYSRKHSNSDLEYYKAFINYVESQLEKKKPQHDPQIKEIVEKVVPLEVKAKETTQIEDAPESDKKTTIRIHLQFLLKSGIFVLFFMGPILLLLIISETFFHWNFLTILQYQTVLFFLLIIVMVLVGLVSGWVSLLLTRYYLRVRKERHEYEGWKEEFDRETPYSEFKGTPTQWYQQFEKFIESKKKDNRGKDSNF